MYLQPTSVPENAVPPQAKAPAIPQPPAEPKPAPPTAAPPEQSAPPVAPSPSAAEPAAGQEKSQVAEAGSAVSAPEPKPAPVAPPASEPKPAPAPSPTAQAASAPPQVTKLDVVVDSKNVGVKPGQPLRVVAHMNVVGGTEKTTPAIEVEYGLYAPDGNALGKPVRRLAGRGPGSYSAAAAIPIESALNPCAYPVKVGIYLDGAKSQEKTAMLQVAPPRAEPPQQTGPDPKLIECRTLVRAGRQALGDRNYDTAIANAAEALSLSAQCPGAQQLAGDAKKAKEEAQARTIIQ
jgi:hypothetical protein